MSAMKVPLADHRRDLLGAITNLTIKTSIFRTWLLLFRYALIELNTSFLREIMWLSFGFIYGTATLITYWIVGMQNVGSSGSLISVGFGQLVPIFLLALPFLAALEAFSHIEDTDSDGESVAQDPQGSHQDYDPVAQHHDQLNGDPPSDLTSSPTANQIAEDGTGDFPNQNTASSSTPEQVLEIPSVTGIPSHQSILETEEEVDLVPATSYDNLLDPWQRPLANMGMMTVTRPQSMSTSSGYPKLDPSPSLFHVDTVHGSRATVTTRTLHTGNLRGVGPGSASRTSTIELSAMERGSIHGQRKDAQFQSTTEDDHRWVTPDFSGRLNTNYSATAAMLRENNSDLYRLRKFRRLLRGMGLIYWLLIIGYAFVLWLLNFTEIGILQLYAAILVILGLLCAPHMVLFVVELCDICKALRAKAVASRRH